MVKNGPKMNPKWSENDQKCSQPVKRNQNQAGKDPIQS